MRKNAKTIATSLTTLIFLVISITGVLMYFHIFDKYTKYLHEILGLVFVAAALFHVFYNYRAMKQYFTNKIFLVSTLIVVAVSAWFVLNSDLREKSPRHLISSAVLKAPINDALKVLGNDMVSFKKILGKKGFVYKNEKSIMQVAKANAAKPFMIVQMLMNENKNKQGMKK